MTAECVQAVHDGYPRSRPRPHSHACFAPTRSVRASRLRTAAEAAGPHSWRHHHSASVPLCCLLPVSPTAVSRAPRPEERSINRVRAAAKANVYMAKVRVRSEGCTRTGGCCFPDLCGGRVEKLGSKCCISS